MNLVAQIGIIIAFDGVMKIWRPKIDLRIVFLQKKLVNTEAITRKVVWRYILSARHWSIVSKTETWLFFSTLNIASLLHRKENLEIWSCKLSTKGLAL